MAGQEAEGSPEVRTMNQEANDAGFVTVILDSAGPSTASATILSQVTGSSPMVEQQGPIREPEPKPEPEQVLASAPEPEQKELQPLESVSKASAKAVHFEEPAVEDTVVRPSVTSNDVPELLASGSAAEVIPASDVIQEVQNGAVLEAREPEIEPVGTAAHDQSTIAPDAPPAVSRTESQKEAEPEIKEDVASQDNPAPPAAETTATPAMEEATSVPHPPDNVNLKELPKVAAGAAVQAGQAYVEASKQATDTIKDLLSLRHKEGPPVTLTVEQIVSAAFLVLVAFQLLLLPIFLPSTFRLIYSLLWGLAVGLGFSFLFYLNKKRKTEVNELLSVQLGLKGVQRAVGGLPAMFSLSDTEKMEWLNALIVEMWPFVDKAVCNKIVEVTAQMSPGIIQTLPMGMSGLVTRLGFKHLTFGGAPIRVESIWVSPERDENLTFEISVKWMGDPNITLAIETPAGAKLCPRIMDITFAGTVRVTLGPMVAKLPGFTAAMITMPSSPLINYRLDFGKAAGGSLAPAAVMPIINYFVRDLVDKNLVWPARVVVPIIQDTPKDAGLVLNMMRRHKGLLRVQVIRGKNLDELGPFDSSMVSLTSDSEYYARTSARTPTPPPNVPQEEIKNHPTGPVNWGDTAHLLIQEPESQALRMEVFDLTAGKGGRTISVGGHRLVGRSMVKLGKVCKAGQSGDLDPVPMVVNLGKHSWGTPGGPGMGCGKMVLRLTYFPFEAITREMVMSVQKGILTVRVIGVRGITPVGTSMSVYVAVNLKSERNEGKPSYHWPKKLWTKAGYIAGLQRKIARLQREAEEDLREGRAEEADRKGAQVAELQKRVDGEGPPPLVTASYQTDPYIKAYYDVTETIIDPNNPTQLKDNTLIVKVVRKGKGVKSSNELAGHVEIPVSEIRNTSSPNLITGKPEAGLYFQGGVRYLIQNPDEDFDDSDWGLPLQAGSGGRILLVIRWVPCIDSPLDMLPDVEDDAHPAMNTRAPAPAPRDPGPEDPLAPKEDPLQKDGVYVPAQ